MFNERVGPVIEKEWADAVLSQRDAEDDEDEDEATQIPPVPIHFRNAALKRLLDAEPSEVHKEVDVWRNAHHGKTRVAAPPDENSSSFDDAEKFHRYADQFQSHICVTETYGSAQQVLASTIQRILQNIEEQTGLIGIFTVVGPQPIRGGNIGAMT